MPKFVMARTPQYLRGGNRNAICNQSIHTLLWWPEDTTYLKTQKCYTQPDAAAVYCG